MLCGHKEISQQLNGSLYMLNDVIVHYFCIVIIPISSDIKCHINVLIVKYDYNLLVFRCYHQKP